MRVIIFGLGNMGKKLLDECLKYECGTEIVAIADNDSKTDFYNSIPVINPELISCYEYDEIWVATVYYFEIQNQLIAQGISKEKIHFMEPVLPILEYRIRNLNLEVNSDNAEAIDYLKTHHLKMYNYPFSDEYFNAKCNIDFDSHSGLFFGEYKGKRLYLRSEYDTEQKARAYINSIMMEQDYRSPHCYFNHHSIRQQRGVALDVGAAEGIYGLSIVDQVDHLYLFESDERWIDALKCTFSEYVGEKVTIIKGYVGNRNDNDNIRLDDFFRKQQIDSLKMDIEGGEMDALLGAKETISNNQVHLAICTYHHRDDNRKISEFLNNIGYVTENSRGVVICCGEWELDKNDAGFRKALLFADKVRE